MDFPIRPFSRMALLLALLVSSGGSAYAQVNISLPSVQAGVGEALEIAVTVGDLTGQGVLAYDFVVVYDAEILTLTGVTTSGTRSQGTSVVSNNATFADGEGLDSARVVMANATVLSGSGTLIKLKATVIGEGTSALTFASFRFNDGSPSANLTNGQVNSGSVPPSANAVSSSTNEDVSVTITLSGSDPGGAALGFSIAEGPAHGSLGTVSVTGSTTATVVYIPDANFSGADSFTYRTTEGSRQSAAATVNITVQAVNDDPIAHPDEAATDTGTPVDIDAAANDEDLESANLKAEPDPSDPPSGGTLAANPDGTLTYTPEEGFAGEDTFGYLVVDEDGGSSAGTIVVNVRAIIDLSISIDGTPDPVSAGGNLTYSVSVVNEGPSDLGTWQLTVILPEDAAFSSVSVAGCSIGGANAVTCEGEGDIPEIEVQMIAPNAPGSSVSGSASVQVTNSETLRQHDPNEENNTATIHTEIESDFDGIADAEEDAVPNRSGGGTGDGNGDGQPDAEQENVASLQNGTDGSFVTIESASGTTLVQIQANATKPESAPPPPQAVTFSDGFLSFGIGGIDAGAETSVIIYTTKEMNSYVKYGPTPDDPEPHWYEFLYDGTTGAEIFEDRVVLHLVDGMRGDGDLEANGAIQDPGGPVINANSAPVVSGDAFQTEEDVTLEILADEGVLANDSDPDGDELHVSLITEAEHGSLALSEDGSFSYTPNENFHGSDSFSYVATDELASDTTAVINTVAAVNDAPTAAEISSPAAGSEFSVGGEVNPVSGTTALFDIVWGEVFDAEDDEVQYLLQISGDAAFSALVDQVDAGADTEAAITASQAAAWSDAVHGSAELGASTTVYARVVATDGSLSTEGIATSFVLIRGTITSRDEEGSLPGQFTLQGNYPNPFNPATTVIFDMPSAGKVRIQLFDVLGREVLAVAPREIPAGAARRLSIDADALPSGLYVYRVTADMATTTKFATGRMTLLK